MIKSKLAKSKPIVARNAVELAKVLGLPLSRAREWEARSALVNEIIALVKAEEITHVELARRAGTSRTRITSILNRNLQHVSTDLLIRIIAALGYRVKFTITRAKLAA